MRFEEEECFVTHRKSFRRSNAEGKRVDLCRRNGVSDNDAVFVSAGL